MLYTTNPREFNRELARELRERKLVSPPAWAMFAKTGSHKERPPQSENWWYERAASILRTVSIKGPIGTAKLAVKYGGRKNRGVAPDQFREAGTNVIRKCLQQLEKSKLIKQVAIDGHKGRIVTKEGAALLKSVLERGSAVEITHRFKDKPIKEKPSTAAQPARPPKEAGA